jgi:pimeloyl-ACP methyl ester carboxylesterase
MLMLFSCSTYKIAERHLDRKMHRASLAINTWVDTVTGDTIEYWDNNSDKPAMVLVHGFGASTKYQFSDQVKVLSEKYRLILPNLYHFGNTRPGSEKYTVQNQVELVEHLVEHLELENYTLCGVSYGGLISIEYALKHEAAIEKLVLFDAPIKFMDSSDISTVKDYFQVPSIEELFVPEKPEGLKKLLFLATGKNTPLPKAVFNEFHENAYANNLEDKRQLITELIGGLEEYQTHTYELDLPILLIWGEDDMVVPVDRGKLLKEHLGDNAELHIIKKSAHMPNMTKTRKFNTILMEFLAK